MCSSDLVIQPEDTLYYLIKYKTANTKEGLISYDYEKEIHINRERIIDSISVLGIDKIPDNVPTIKYTFSLFDSKTFNVKGVSSVYLIENLSKNHTIQNIKTKGKPISEIFYSDNIEDKDIISVVFYFTIPDTEEEFYYAYTAALIEETEAEFNDEIQYIFTQRIVKKKKQLHLN